MATLHKLRVEEYESGRVTPPMVTPPLQMTGFALGGGYNRPKLLRRQSSLSSVSSVCSEDEDEQMDASYDEWSDQDEDILSSALEDFLDGQAASNTPFTGLPPSQLLHAISKAVIKKEKKAWNHSLKATRTKLLELARRRQSIKSFGHDVDATPKIGSTVSFDADADDELEQHQWGRADTEATPKRLKRRQPLARQNSMDFLPAQRETGTLNRLSHKLHQTTSPYKPRNASRSGSYSSGSSATQSYSSIPLTYSIGTPLSPIQSTPRAKSRANSAPRQPLARIESEPIFSLQCPPSPTDSIDSTSSFGSSYVPTLQSFSSNTSLGSSFGSDSSTSSFPTPKGFNSPARRPSLIVEGRLSSLSLKPKNMVLQTPKSVERLGISYKDSELPDSPSPSLTTKKSQTLLLTAYEEGNMMELDSPFREDEPLHAW